MTSMLRRTETPARGSSHCAPSCPGTSVCNVRLPTRCDSSHFQALSMSIFRAVGRLSLPWILSSASTRDVCAEAVFAMPRPRWGDEMRSLQIMRKSGTSCTELLNRASISKHGRNDVSSTRCSRLLRGFEMSPAADQRCGSAPCEGCACAIYPRPPEAPFAKGRTAVIRPARYLPGDSEHHVVGTRLGKAAPNPRRVLLISAKEAGVCPRHHPCRQLQTS
jgi:hypothetical protein